MAEITINNIKINANEGEYLLNVARANGIFIPAICYLSGCSPTLACKLCMVEADGKRVYACNAKVKDGMSVITNTPEIAKERKAIMQSYCVNHPLECGVCDKSGECELQDFTLLFGVDDEPYFVEDSLKKIELWGQVKYDPSLCILCERCVTTCKDNLGEANLKAVKCDSIPQIDASIWKEIMPKDAFSVWNRKQKAIIGFVGEHQCIDCVECVSVCPVGALGVKSFQYTTNAWELQKIDSTCNLCPSGCKITLEGKKDANNEMQLYRVSNDFNFNPICASGRFAQHLRANLANNNASNAICAIKNAKIINVGGNTTNNEAKFLQGLKEHFGIKLVNKMLKNYFDILDIFGESRIESLENITQEKLIVAICNPKYENPLLRYKINNALKMQKDSAFIFAFSIKDKLLASLSKKFLEIIYTPNAEDAMILAICGILEPSILEHLETLEVDFEVQVKEQVKEIKVDENGKESEAIKEITKTNIEKRKYYKIFEKSHISYLQFLELEKMLKNTTPLLILGGDFYNNKNGKILAKILKNLLLQNKIKLILNPPTSNANGIYANLTLDSTDSTNEADSSKMADFAKNADSTNKLNSAKNADSTDSTQKSQKSIGWRMSGDFIFDSIDADFIIPYFNAINDSIVNIDNRLLPINAIFTPSNYLIDLAKALELKIDFCNEKLANFYANDGKDKRGKILERVKKDNIDSALELQEIANIMPQNGDFNAILRDVSPHFYPYTKYSNNLYTKIGIYVSKSKMQDLSLESGLKIGDCIELEVNGCVLKGEIYIDFEMEGDFFAISPQLDNAKNAFGDKRFAKAILKGVAK